MKGLFVILIISFAYIISCKNDTQESKKKNKERKSKIETLKNNTIKEFYPNDTVLVYKIVKTKEPLCNNWVVPPKKDILSILMTLEQVSGREWNDCYGDWSCGAEGEIYYKKEKYYFRIDAGGWIILSNGKTQKYFVCKKNKECWDIFPSECFCDESGIIIDTP